MKIPKKVDILGIIYDVELNKSRLIEQQAGGGYCDPLKQMIFVSTQAKKDVREEIFLHEIMEALNSQLELELKHSVLQSIVAGLRTIMKTNKLNFSS